MSEPANTPPPAIAAAIIVQAGKVLLVRRRVNEGTLSWQFPAGAVEPGETPAQAAVREIAEETHLTVAPVESIGERVHPLTGRKIVYLVCQVVSGQATVGDKDELAEVTWASHADLPALVPHGLFETVQAYLDRTLR